MGIPTALAPTQELAHPKVEKFANGLATILGATIHRFYACEPCVKQVFANASRDSVTWLVGDWGLELLCRDFSNDDYSIRTIDVEFIDARIHPEHGMIITLQLSARVMR